ncbi:MAG: hypothetical protein HBSAPP01_20490 [Candidatus Brocadia sapporoensis]|nr:MAG: hypothetical protein HBSAPP01_20490 [Candidatus Brocadia sapporoensis]
MVFPIFLNDPTLFPTASTAVISNPYNTPRESLKLTSTVALLPAEYTDGATIENFALPELRLKEL